MVSEEELTREISSSELCDVLGGRFRPLDDTCQFLEEPSNFDRSVSEPKYAIFYVLQIFVGITLTMFGTFFGVTVIPPFWYVNLIFLIIASIAFIFSDWYREGELLESIMRFVFIFPVFVITSILIATVVKFGTVLNITYWIPKKYFINTPVIATILSLFASALLNVFLLPKIEIMEITAIK